MFRFDFHMLLRSVSIIQFHLMRNIVAAAAIVQEQTDARASEREGPAKEKQKIE